MGKARKGIYGELNSGEDVIQCNGGSATDIAERVIRRLGLRMKL